VRFKIDENLPVELASLLTRAGHHATTVVAEQLQGKADSTTVGVCVREKRVLVTLDLDFADIRAYPPDQYPGLIVLRVHQQDKEHLIRTFEHAIPVLGQERIEGRLWIVEERRIRIRGEKA